MPRVKTITSVKKKLLKIARSLRKSKSFVGIFSHLDDFVIKAKRFSFILVCKLNIVCFYVTEKTFEIFDPSGFLKTMRCLKRKILCKLASFARDKDFCCNDLTKTVCVSIFSQFVKLRDAGNSFFATIKKLL